MMKSCLYVCLCVLLCQVRTIAFEEEGDNENRSSANYPSSILPRLPSMSKEASKSPHSRYPSDQPQVITVSGLSSGGYMAVQFHVAYSAVVNGSAIFAGGPYYCAESSLALAEKNCMNGAGVPPVAELVALTVEGGIAGTIDSTANLLDDRVYMFSGQVDSVVKQYVVKSLLSYYSAFMKNSASQIKTEFSLNAEHCLPTLDYGETCTTLSSPYLGQCSYDGAGEALEFLLGPGLAKPTKPEISSNLFAFDQTPYFTGSYTSIGKIGYIYVPTACHAKMSEGGSNSHSFSLNSACRLHVSFHGCEQNLEVIGSEYAVHAGFNSWAEANNIVILYPYVVSSNVPYNPNGCWDWWAYTGENYGLKSGVQMTFVKRLVDEILA